MSLTPSLAEYREKIEKVAKGYGLDFYDTIFEMVDSELVNSLAAYGGFPVRYPHWRWGMDYDQLSKGYTWGQSKIYEMVINTDPAIAYLVKGNSEVEQKLVMAHVYGHVDFFKNNTWFSKTNRRMLDTMANHAVRIRNYMETHGQEPVEAFIDACLSLENLIDPHLPFQPEQKRESSSILTEGVNPAEEKAVPGKLKSNREYMEHFINPKEFLDSEKKKAENKAKQSRRIPAEPQKDVLAFLLEYGPLEQWQHDVLSIVRDEAYYFVPQMQTKIMNEGWASYWHSKIMTQHILKDSEIVDFADVHAGSMAVAPGRMNPYKIGLEIFRDIEERWDRGRFGKEYDDCDDMVAKAKWDRKVGKGREKMFEVRRACNDITFIDGYLTPDVAERCMLYTYEFNRRTNQYEIVDRDFGKVKEKLLGMLTNAGQPFIYVKDGNFENRGELLLWHKHQGVDLDVKWAEATLRSVSTLWGRPVNVETESEGQKKLLTWKGGEFTEKNL
ncbi:MAG: SpoVR family protein [Bdellovibrionales bacterium]|nr:SpoVR family protein [Bdellovibrionales bacterium]